jgi:hypothetical protein
MPKSLQRQLPPMELRALKCELRRASDSFVRGGKVFEQAVNRCGWSKDEASGHYGVSASLMTRQMQNADNQHLSFQRICEMPAQFRKEIAIGLLEDVDGVAVDTVVTIKRVA